MWWRVAAVDAEGNVLGDIHLRDALAELCNAPCRRLERLLKLFKHRFDCFLLLHHKKVKQGEQERGSGGKESKEEETEGFQKESERVLATKPKKKKKKKKKKERKKKGEWVSQRTRCF